MKFAKKEEHFTANKNNTKQTIITNLHHHLSKYYCKKGWSWLGWFQIKKVNEKDDQAEDLQRQTADMVRRSDNFFFLRY